MMASSHFGFWLAASLLAIGSCYDGGKVIRVGEEQGWALGVDYKDLYVSAPNTLAFTFDGSSDVWMQREAGCNFKAGNNLLANATTAVGGLAMRITDELSGTYFISSSFGDNCEAGMRFALHILPAKCATECGAKCATTVCPLHPLAECVRKSCTTCEHAFIVDGKQVECSAESFNVGVTSADRLLSESTANITVQHTGTHAAPRGKKGHSNSKYPGFCEEPVLVDADKQIFTVHCISPSVSMLPGHVINTNLLFVNPFPADRTVAIVKQSAQLVHAADQKPVPADEVYMHHFVTMDTLIVPPPTGQGSIWRSEFPEPYSLIVPAGHLGPPAKRYVNLHLINTIGVEDKMSCVECRCPKVPLAKVSAASKIPAGGVICCKNCPTNAETGAVDYALQYDSVYRLLEPDSSIAPVRLARLDGALGAGERIEYEIPYNPTGEQNVVKYNLTLNQLVPGDEIDGDVEIIRCDGHQHMGGQCLELYNMATKELICTSCPRIGTETGVIGNEKGYVVAMSSTEIAPAKKLSPDVNLQMVCRYDATSQHTGVMSILFLYYSQGPRTVSALTSIDAEKQSSNSQTVQSFEDFATEFPSILSHASPDCQEQIWEVYTNCPLNSANAKSEENAVVCCSMMGALAATKCTCTEAGYAEPNLLAFLMTWEASCTTAQAWDMYALACHHSASWAFENIFAFVGSDVVVRPLFEDVQRCLMAFMLNWGNALFALVIYFTVNNIMVTISPAYRRLPGGERFQCCVHCVFMFVFALQFIPYSYVMAKLLFGPDFQETAAGWEYLVLMCAVFNHAYIYIIEGGFRCVVKSNMMLLVHHLIFFLLPPITQYFGSVMAFKVVYTIDLFATYEFALYSALIMRRLGAPTMLTKKAITVGIWIYGVSRFVQFTILAYFFIGSFAKIGDTAVYWVLTILTTILMFIQLYTFVIYRNIYVGLDDWAIESAAGKESQHDWIDLKGIFSQRESGKFGIQLTDVASDEDDSIEDQPLNREP